MYNITPKRNRKIDIVSSYGPNMVWTQSKKRMFANNEETSKSWRKEQATQETNKLDPNPNASAQYTGIEVLNHASFLVLLKGLRGPLFWSSKGSAWQVYILGLLDWSGTQAYRTLEWKFHIRQKQNVSMCVSPFWPKEFRFRLCVTKFRCYCHIFARFPYFLDK
jgi:hypothetical protein